MSRMAAWATAGAIFALTAPGAMAATDLPQAGLAKQLLQGCLGPPSEAATAKLAAAVGARPFSDARNRRQTAQHNTTVVPDPTAPGEADRTETQVTAYRGWDLPQPGAGTIYYDEETIRQDRIEQPSGQSISALKVQLSRTCHVGAQVANARGLFETYEGLDDRSYGILISADRTNIVVFIFEPDAYDIELDIGLAGPLAGLPVGRASEGASRLVLNDAGPRYMNSVVPGVPTVILTRKALLEGLDRPASMSFSNSVMEPVVQRIAEGPTSAAGTARPPAPVVKPAAAP